MSRTIPRTTASDARTTKPARRSGTTIRDVAERASVSQMTVSRVLNNKPLVSDETRQRVRAAMRELNYRPNLMARNLAGRSGLFIGLLYRNPSYGYLSEFLLGALEACRRMGHYLVVEEPLTHDEMIDLDRIEARFLDTSIQAVIVIPPLSDDPKLIATLEDAGIEFVRVSSNLEGIRQSVGIDDRAAARDVIDYLRIQGHERIGVIGGPASHLASRLRMEGVRDAFAVAGTPLDDTLVTEGDFTYGSGFDGAAALLALDDPPTAIFAFNDDMAAGAIASAYRAQRDVPGDVSIVGFDDTANAASSYPPLTTMRQPIREIAQRAIETLVQVLDEPGSAEAPSVLDYALTERASVAPPRRAGPA